ncbi:hypothetical protein N665_0292s0019 [Sinapis alba]|nr:hypothetical protein N665_0292s0019 [Sinapis alba]
MVFGSDLMSRLVKPLVGATAFGLMPVTSTPAHSSIDIDLVAEFLYGAPVPLLYKTTFCRLESSFLDLNPSLLEESTMSPRYRLKASRSDYFSGDSRNGANANLSHRVFHAGVLSMKSTLSVRGFTPVRKLMCSAEMFYFIIYKCGFSGSRSNCMYRQRRSSHLLWLSTPAHYHPEPPSRKVYTTLFRSTVTSRRFNRRSPLNLSIAFRRDLAKWVYEVDLNVLGLNLIKSIKNSSDHLSITVSKSTRWLRRLVLLTCCLSTIYRFIEGFFETAMLITSYPSSKKKRLSSCVLVGSLATLSPSSNAFSMRSVLSPAIKRMNLPKSLTVLLSCGAVCTGPEDATEFVSTIFRGVDWLLTSLYVIIFLLSDFVVKAISTHSSFVLDSLSSSFEELSCLAYIIVVYGLTQRGWIIPSSYCKRTV